jgi:sugar O-acyltransferase (sialic acid O-acetyltransferase NeuD family)
MKPVDSPIYVFGAGGLALEIIDLAVVELGVDPALLTVVVADLADPQNRSVGLPVVDETTAFTRMRDSACAAIIPIGTSRIRARIHGRIIEAAPHCGFPSLVSPQAMVTSHYPPTIAEGAIVHPGALLSARASVGAFSVVGAGTLVNHEARLDAFVTLAPGSNVCGCVAIGERSTVFAGAVVIDEVSVCADVTIGAGAVVIRDITEPGTYAGVPARRLGD